MNELLIRAIVPVLSILDTYWTYRRVVLYKKINIDATQLELNGLTKLLWNKLGLRLGSFMAGIVSLTIIMTLCSLFSLYFVCFIIGVLTITDLLHLTDLSKLKQVIKQGGIKNVSKRTKVY